LTPLEGARPKEKEGGGKKDASGLERAAGPDGDAEVDAEVVDAAEESRGGEGGAAIVSDGVSASLPLPAEGGAGGESREGCDD